MRVRISVESSAVGLGENLSTYMITQVCKAFYNPLRAGGLLPVILCRYSEDLRRYLDNSVFQHERARQDQ